MARLLHITHREMVALNSIATKLHNVAVDHGWWEYERNLGEILCLIHSEVSEALESLRNNEGQESFAEELADIIIRTLDLAARLNINIGYTVLRKNEINIDRPHKHGKEF